MIPDLIDTGLTDAEAVEALQRAHRCMTRAETEEQIGHEAAARQDADDVLTAAVAQINAALLDCAAREELNDAVGALAALGAKNLLKVTSATQTINGVTFTVNNDQTITVNGTNTSTSTALFVIEDIPLQSGIAYTLSGCPSGGSTASYYIGSLDTTNWQEFTTDTGNGNTATLNEPKTIRFRIGIRSGVTVNNLVFKPMLRLAEITDSTYVPYAPTNRELYEMILALQSGRSVQSSAASLMQSGRLDAELTDTQEVTDDA